jgi:peptide/nickel transport system substrate-binding protein
MPNPLHPRPSRRQFLLYASLFGGAAATGALSACGPGEGGRAAGRAGEAGETLFVAGFQWGPPNHFNPLGQSPAWPSGEDSIQLLYESLLRYNILTGELEPGLGAELRTPDENTFVIPLQPGVRWQDGEPLTAEDVVYRFELPRRHEQLDATIWDYITGVEADGDAVVFHLDPDHRNPGVVRHVISRSSILPRHIWERYEAEGPIDQHTNLDPVGSGPYRLVSHNPEHVALERLDDYWGRDVYGLPAPRFVNHPIFSGNEAGAIAFQEGRIDVMQQFTPELWRLWEEEDLPVGTWFREEPYHLAGSIPMLVVNTTRPGLADPRVRRALAFAIDYADIADKAMSRYSEPVRSSLLLPTGAEGEYFDQANVDAHGWRYDPAESARILEGELGARRDGDGVYVLPDGTRLGPWQVQAPTGWTDWQAALRIVAANAREAGFDIATEFPQADVVSDAVANGNFDLAMWFIAGVGPASPWQRFRDVLDSRGVPSVGSRAYWNFGRFEAGGTAELLDALAAATDQAEATRLTGELDRIFMANAPMIPLMYRPDQFYEFHEANWTNFPHAEDAYAPPQFHGAGIRWLFALERR